MQNWVIQTECHTYKISMKGCVNQTIYVPLITYSDDQALGFEDATALVHDGLLFWSPSYTVFSQ